jgi:hypothetical protein
MKPLVDRTPVLDLRTYKLVPGWRKTFDDILRERALPMLRRYGTEVVGCGPSLADDVQDAGRPIDRDARELRGGKLPAVVPEQPDIPSDANLRNQPLERKQLCCRTPTPCAVAGCERDTR